MLTEAAILAMVNRNDICGVTWLPSSSISAHQIGVDAAAASTCSPPRCRSSRVCLSVHLLVASCVSVVYSIGSDGDADDQSIANLIKERRTVAD